MLTWDCSKGAKLGSGPLSRGATTGPKLHREPGLGSHTPVPEIRAEIDVLRTVHAWRQGFDAYPVWVARRGEPA